MTADKGTTDLRTPRTEAGRRAVEAIKGGALALWANDADDPIAAMIADVERAAILAAKKQHEQGCALPEDHTGDCWAESGTDDD